MKRIQAYMLITALKWVYGFRATKAGIIYAQAYHESGGFTSNIFKENNNCFGLKEPSQRPTTATGTSRGHATYDSVKDCIVDYFLRQSYFSQVQDEPDPETFIYQQQFRIHGTGHNYAYAEDPQYVQLVMEVYNSTNFTALKAGATAITALGGAAAVGAGLITSNIKRGK